MKKQFLQSALFSVALLFATSLFAQDWVNMMNDPDANFFEVQKAFDTYAKDYKANYKLENSGAEPAKIPGHKMFRRWEHFMKSRVSETGVRPAPDAVWKAMEEYKKGYNQPMAGNWTFIGPSTTGALAGAGRVNFVRVHPTNSSKIYVGSPSGGLWISTNGGTTWTTSTDMLPQVIGCTDVAFDPSNPNTMFMATGDGDGGDNYSVGLLKSIDGGNTWSPCGLTFTLGTYRLISKIIIDPTGQIINVATSLGIYRSTNGGTTFSQAISSTTAPVPGAFKDMEAKPGTPATIYACGTEFWKTTDGGAVWAKITSGLPVATAVQRMAIAVTAADPNVVSLVVMKATTYDMEGVYRSTNSGGSFTKNSSSPAIGNQGFYDLCIAISPTNANEILLGGQTQFMRTANGNVASPTWSNVIGGMHVDFHDVIYSGSNIYVTSDGGVWRATSSSGPWTDLSNNLAISQMYGFGHSKTNPNLIIQGWQDNGTNLYNGSWQVADGGDGMLAFISHGSDNNMWSSQYNGTLKRSTNGGASFSTIGGITQGTSEQCPWVTEWNEDPTTAGTVYAGCSNVWKSTGGNFSKLSNIAGTSSVTISAIGVSPASSQVMWTAKGGILYKSTNAGAAWTAITGLPTGNISDIVCHPTDVNKAWISYSGFSNINKVFQTTNQGTSWTNLSSSLPNISVNCMAIDKNGNDALYVGTDAGVFFKDASLSVWQPFSTNLPNVVVSQVEIFYGSPAKIRASTYGRGMWESTLYAAGTYPPDANFAGSILVGCPGLGVQFSDYTSGSPTTWSWSFPGGSPAASTAQNPFVVYNTPGTYSVSLTATNANGTDTQVFGSYMSIASAQAAPTSASYTICGPVAVTLTATPSAAGTVRWWNAPSGGTLIGSDNTSPYSISPTLWGTQTVYVDEAFPPGNIDITAAPDNTMGGGALFTANDIRGLYFDVLKPVKINSVKVYTGAAGMRTIEIIDANGNLVTDTTLNVAASGTVTPTTVTINRTVYPGTNYFIKFRGLVDAYRNSDGPAYPYTDGGSNALTITGSNAGTLYYYFFYDWQFTNIVCNTGRTAVPITDNCSLTGVEDVFTSNLLHIYPNPNNGKFTLTFHTENTDDYLVKITNTIGQAVYEEKLNSFSGTYSNEHDISAFNKGVYMLSVSNSKNETVKKVLVH